LNKAVTSKDDSLSVGHSYFMTEAIRSRKHASNDYLKFIWRYFVLPLVAEYEYELNAKEIEEKYGLETIRRAVG